MHLLVPTLGELMKARWPGSRNVAVAGKDRAAVMMTGQQRRPALVLDRQEIRDRPCRASGSRSSSPRSNAALAAALAQPRAPLEPPPFCQAKARAIAIEGGGKPVGAGRLARAAGDAGRRSAPRPSSTATRWRSPPALVDEMQLGRGAAPDLLAISLSATDYVGHAYGTEGEEMCLQLTRARPRARRFPRRARQPRDRLCGGADRRPWRQGHPRARAPRRASPTRRGSIPASRGVRSGKSWSPAARPDRRRAARRSIGGDIYIDAALPPADRKRLLAAAVAAYQAAPAGRGGVHRRAARRDPGADRLARPMDA